MQSLQERHFEIGQLQGEIWRVFAFAMLLFLIVEGILILPARPAGAAGGVRRRRKPEPGGAIGMSHFSLAAPLSVDRRLRCSGWARPGFAGPTGAAAANRRAAGKLESLRFILITLLAFTLLRPEYVENLQRTAMPEIAILADGSDSMKTRDLVVSSAFMSRGQWLAAQLQRAFWRALAGQGEGFGGNFRRAFHQSKRHQWHRPRPGAGGAFHRFKNLKAVLLLSDGDWNMGKSPLGAATRYREQNIPVFTVPWAAKRRCRIWRWRMFRLPAYGLLGEEIAIPFKVTSHLPREVKTSRFDLRRNSAESASKKITIPPNGEVEDSILWSPRAAGE